MLKMFVMIFRYYSMAQIQEKLFKLIAKYKYLEF